MPILNRLLIKTKKCMTLGFSHFPYLGFLLISGIVLLHSAKNIDFRINSNSTWFDSSLSCIGSTGKEPILPPIQINLPSVVQTNEIAMEHQLKIAPVGLKIASLMFLKNAEIAVCWKSDM